MDCRWLCLRFRCPRPGGGPAIRVLEVHSIQIGDTSVVGVDALAIASDGDIVVGGTLSVAAAGETRGPGGNKTCDINAGTGHYSLTPQGDTHYAGGGGGTFGAPGGAGGNNGFGHGRDAGDRQW